MIKPALARSLIKRAYKAIERKSQPVVVEHTVDRTDAALDATRAAIKIQSIVRQSLTRLAVIDAMQDQGTILAMPGTIQNQSGWYEVNQNGIRMVAQLRRKSLHMEDSWELIQGPVPKHTWRQLVYEINTAPAGAFPIPTSERKPERAPPSFVLCLALSEIVDAAKLVVRSTVVYIHKQLPDLPACLQSTTAMVASVRHVLFVPAIIAYRQMISAKKIVESEIISQKNAVIDQMQDDMQCVICREQQKAVLLLPCRHLCLCQGCSHKHELPSCPVCRTHVVERMRIYT
jgi:hypothetical protein